MEAALSLFLERAEKMENGRRGRRDRNQKAGAFFVATLLLWVVSVVFEMTFNRRRELLPVIVGFCFFEASNRAIRFALSRDALLVNTAVSLLHSTITSLSVVTILINEWMSSGLNNMFDHSRLFSSTWQGAYTALCFSCGYFSYDQWDMLRYRLYSGWIPSILLHHLILLVCFTLALYRNVTVNYLILTLLCELHSIFLHTRKVRRMTGIRDRQSKIVKAEWVANWATFFVARFGCHIFITYKVIKDAPKFGKGIELPLALCGMVGMNVLNVFLGLDLFKAYKREKNDLHNHQE